MLIKRKLCPISELANQFRIDDLEKEIQKLKNDLIDVPAGSQAVFGV
jgi:hypothetical protein